MQDFTQRIEQIRNDHEHGSRWLVRQAIDLMHELAIRPASSPEEQLQRLRQAGYALAHARPAMAALAGVVGRVLSASGSAGGMAQAAEQLRLEYDQSIERITAAARPHLHGTIMTHSLSGTVLEVLRACIPSIEHIIVLEGRPLYEGRATLQALQDQAIGLTLITDAQADIFLPVSQAVVVGADSLLADGGLLNKAGTALLAWAARGHAVPFYVLSETLKISPRIWSGDQAWLEEQSGREVWPESIPGVRVRNFYFDYTPHELITQIITEKGALEKTDLERYTAQLRGIPEIA